MSTFGWCITSAVGTDQELERTASTAGHIESIITTRKDYG